MNTLTKNLDLPSIPLKKSTIENTQALDQACKLYYEDVLTRFFNAIRKRDLKTVYQLSDNQKLINARSINGTTPLLLATTTNNPAMVELLLGSNADASLRNRRGETPLLRAAFWGYIQVAELLIQKGNADVNETSPLGWTPLHKAAFQGRTDMVKLLLQYGADPTPIVETIDGGFTPLKLAHWHRRDQTARLLRKHGISS